MNVLSRNKRKIYYCEMFLNDDGIENFKVPVPIFLNFAPVNNSNQLFAYGNTYPLYLKGIVLNQLAKKYNFKAGDKFYIYSKIPQKVDLLCEGADYILENKPSDTLNFTELEFKRLTSDMTYE